MSWGVHSCGWQGLDCVWIQKGCEFRGPGKPPQSPEHCRGLGLGHGSKVIHKRGSMFKNNGGSVSLSPPRLIMRTHFLTLPGDCGVPEVEVDGDKLSSQRLAQKPTMLTRRGLPWCFPPPPKKRLCSKDQSPPNSELGAFPFTYRKDSAELRDPAQGL